MPIRRSAVLPLLVVIAFFSSRAARAQGPAPAAPPPPAAPPTPAAPAAAPPLASPPPIVPPPKVAGPQLQITELRVLHDKGILDDAAYASAMKDLNDSLGSRAENATTFAVGKWATTIYGFAELDAIHDSTQGLTEVAGATPIARSIYDAGQGLSDYKGSHGQTMFSVRNSRLGFRLSAPTLGGVHPSAVLEMDLLGSLPPAAVPSDVFPGPVMRLRHAYGKVETPVVDILFGQTWALLGWQSVYHPNSVEIQGLPGELYSRVPQLRLSKTVNTGAVTLEFAGAALRPPSAGSEAPEAQAGIRFAVNPWTGVTTNGATATSVQPLSIAVTGDYRHYEVPNVPFNGPPNAMNVPTPNPVPNGSARKDSAALAVDAFIPVIPGSVESKANSLSLNGEFVTGTGMADMYSSLTGGITFPNVPIAGVQNVAYPQNVDNGLLTFDTTNFNLHPIQWTTYLVGLQYYLPGLDGRMWISGNYSHIQSGNTKQFSNPTDLANPSVPNYAPASTVLVSEDWWDVNVFGDVAAAVRVGAEFASFYDRYAPELNPTTPSLNHPDGVRAINQRIQLSGWFLF